MILRHRLWHTIGLALLGLFSVRAKDIGKIPPWFTWKFQTKLQLAVRFFLPLAKLAQDAGKSVWEVADGAFAKRAFLKPLLAAGVVVVSRLRKDAALYDLPPRVKRRGRGRP